MLAGNIVIYLHSELDVIAIKCKCCKRYYACFFCHEELEDHEPARWSEGEFGEQAILCGVCMSELTIRDYLSSGFACPSCRSPAGHYDLYFDIRRPISTA